MSHRDGRGVGSKASGYTNSRTQRRAYTKCNRHAKCRNSSHSIWRKR